MTAVHRWRAFALLAVSTMSLGWAASLPILALLMAVLGVASGFAGVPPAAMLADVLPEDESARGVATFRFGADLGCAKVVIARVSGLAV